MNRIKDIFLNGDSVFLRMLSEEDINGNYARWLNDAEVTMYNSHGRFPISVGKLQDFVQSVYESNTTLVLAVCDKTSGAHIGNISLQSISWIDRSAEIAFLLGEKDFWGKSVMHDAGKLLIKHAFEVLNLHRIHCGTSSENIGMQKLAGKLGMNLEGVRKEAFFKNGNYYDILEYGLLSR
jgi:ribosomal-protein-alanine N-acetyltransferase